MWIVSLLSGPRPLYEGRLTKGTDVGGERRQAQRGRGSLPTTSEEGLIPATAVYCHGMPSAGLHFRNREGLERWYRLINRASLIIGMAVSERKVGGLSVPYLSPWPSSPRKGCSII